MVYSYECSLYELSVHGHSIMYVILYAYFYGLPKNVTRAEMTSMSTNRTGTELVLTLYCMNYFTILASKCTQPGGWFMQ